MEFCPECDNILLSKKKKSESKGKKKSSSGEKVVFCPSCGYERPMNPEETEKYKLKQKIKHSPKDKTVILDKPVSATKFSEEEREAMEDFFQAEAGGD